MISALHVIRRLINLINRNPFLHLLASLTTYIHCNYNRKSYSASSSSLWREREGRGGMGLVTVGELKPTGKRGFRVNSSIRHASEW